MATVISCEPTDLYNILNQKTLYPCLSDPNYLLLLDARKKNEYNESHIVTGKKAPKDEDGNFVVPYDAELECKQHVIVYDSRTDSLKDTDTDAYRCAKVMSDMGSRHPVKILKGGYEDFSALYPFLRTQKIIFMPREMDELATYPIETLPGLLYMGTRAHGNASYVQKDLKVKGHINCCMEKQELSLNTNPFTQLHFPIEDSSEADMFSKFHEACSFIDHHKENDQVVLIFSQLGISRSACLTIAYVIYHKKIPLKDAYAHVKGCCRSMRPNRGLIEQLSRWEEEILGQKVTDIADPNF